VVPSVPNLTKVTGSATTIHAGSRYPVPVTLAALAYNGWVKSNSVFSADTVNIYNASTGKFDVYFQRLDNSQWNKVGGGTVNYGSVSISPDTGYSLTKTGSVTGSASFLYAVSPYAL